MRKRKKKKFQLGVYTTSGLIYYGSMTAWVKICISVFLSVNYQKGHFLATNASSFSGVSCPTEIQNFGSSSKCLMEGIGIIKYRLADNKNVAPLDENLHDASKPLCADKIPEGVTENPKPLFTSVSLGLVSITVIVTHQTNCRK